MKLFQTELDTEMLYDKKKVYITGSARDFTENRELVRRIEQAILKSYGCVCYTDMQIASDTDSDPALRTAQLSAMDLIVLLVTKPFLTQHGLGIDFDFPCAVEKSVPILPILCEPGLEQEFSRICGHYHLLDACRDSFSYNLKEYLCRLFENPVYLVQPADPFSVKVFFSYRKKDRLLATKLIERLQNETFCINAEIWFDDFLAEGENFDENIDRHLRECDFVVMTVSPSIFEETDGHPNYVLATEYPNACAYGKPILAVETEPVDHAAFHRLFPQAVLVPAGNPETLKRAVHEFYAKLSLALPQMTPGQAFSAGKAYLYGVRAYRNVPLGLDMLRQAGDCGYAPAYGVIAMYYHHRSDSEADLRIAHQYYEKCVRLEIDIIKQLKEKKDDVKNRQASKELAGYCMDLAYMLISYNTLCRQLHLRDTLICNLNDYITACQVLRECGLWSEKINIGNAQLAFAVLCKEDGKLRESLAMLDDAERLFGMYFTKTEGRLHPNKQYACLWMTRGEVYLALAKESGDADAYYSAAGALMTALPYYKWLNNTVHTEYENMFYALDTLFRCGYNIETKLGDKRIAAKIYETLCDACDDARQYLDCVHSFLYLASLIEMSLAYIGEDVPVRVLLCKAAEDVQAALEIAPQKEEYRQQYECLIRALEALPEDKT